GRDVVALEVRAVGVGEEAPVDLVPPQQLVAVRGPVAEERVDQPAVADLVGEHREGRVLAEEAAVEVVGILGDRVHGHEALQAARAAYSALRFCRPTPMPASALVTVCSYENVLAGTSRREV